MGAKRSWSVEDLERAAEAFDDAAVSLVTVLRHRVRLEPYVLNMLMDEALWAVRTGSSRLECLEDRLSRAPRGKRSEIERLLTGDNIVALPITHDSSFSVGATDTRGEPREGPSPLSLEPTEKDPSPIPDVSDGGAL